MFESKEQMEKIEKLTAAVQDMVALQRDLLKKLEQQNVSLGALTKFVRENSGITPACGAI
ncbi:hypothetical protein SBA1_550107 [Candidatus Sulfotelmatobacter kueseliae]|uniref:Uncharacterized protein n=1 Tax=Candidatus Sulfotelmatobacter kueseliae TaxID=2042962 RepID=A0A2U3KYN3_9BACT|nr:hypothetical protein SBA1_550107 [Candidatus Sulfotelmatobacter kueseliae]